mgnify:CR=1 FL=1
MTTDWAAKQQTRLEEAIYQTQHNLEIAKPLLDPILEKLRSVSMRLREELDELEVWYYTQKYYFDVGRKWKITGIANGSIYIDNEDDGESYIIPTDIIGLDLDQYFIDERERLIRESLVDAQKKLKEFKEETKIDPRTKLENKVQKLQEILGDKKEAKK